MVLRVELLGVTAFVVVALSTLIHVLLSSERTVFAKSAMSDVQKMSIGGFVRTVVATIQGARYWKNDAKLTCVPFVVSLW